MESFLVVIKNVCGWPKFYWYMGIYFHGHFILKLYYIHYAWNLRTINHISWNLSEWVRVIINIYKSLSFVWMVHLAVKVLIWLTLNDWQLLISLNISFVWLTHLLSGWRSMSAWGGASSLTDSSRRAWMLCSSRAGNSVCSGIWIHSKKFCITVKIQGHMQMFSTFLDY